MYIRKLRTAFIIPAYNEEGAIGKTITSAFNCIPDCKVYVCDNNSSDSTRDEAIKFGAIVITETRKGKGNAVRKLLNFVEADIYIMVDGDNTYNLQYLPSALNYFVENDLDIMTGNRFAIKNKSYMRKGHELGNKSFTKLLNYLCNVETSDILSGLRIMSRSFIDSFPIISSEFEIETEISVFASKMKFGNKDFPTEVKSRENTLSKLNTYKDGLKIIYFILHLLHREFPLKLYLPISFFQIIVSSIFLIGIYTEFSATGLVERFPTLIVACFILMSGLLSFCLGLVLKGLVHIKYENRYLAYLSSKRYYNKIM
tara:strand:+ start:136 stop:1077 length:942 start_codon:yes stop_codon:yes gene_type:complete